MIFALGYIAGLLTAILVIVVLVYLRHPIEKTLKVVEKHIELAGPRPRGFVIEPPDEAEEVRQSVIAKNRAQGRDTKLSELQ